MPTTPAGRNNSPAPATEGFYQLTQSISASILGKFKSDQVLPLPGEQVTSSQFKAKLDAYNQAVANLNAAREAVKRDEAALMKLSLELKPLISGFHHLLKAAFGATSSILAKFGFVPAKVVTPATVEQKLAAKTRAAETLKAKKQSAADLNEKLVAIKKTSVTVTASLKAPLPPGAAPTAVTPPDPAGEASAATPEPNAATTAA